MFGGQGGIRKSYLKLTAIVCKNSTTILFSSDEKGSAILNLVFTLKSNCIHGQKKTPSVYAQSGSKFTFLLGF